MAVRSTQCQNRAVRSTQGGRGCHPHIGNRAKLSVFKATFRYIFIFEIIVNNRHGIQRLNHIFPAQHIFAIFQVSSLMLTFGIFFRNAKWNIICCCTRFMYMLYVLMGKEDAGYAPLKTMTTVI